MRGLPGQWLVESMRRPVLRWSVAVAATIITFAVATWLCGGLVLPTLKVHDPSIRWSIASGLGVAVAALAALWGNFYATSETEKPQLEAEPNSASLGHKGLAAHRGEGETTSDISGGTFRQPVIQGRDFGKVSENPQPGASRPPPRRDDDHTTTLSGGGTHNTIRDGLFHGLVIQGRDFGTINLGGLAQPSDPAVSADDQPGQK